MFALMLVVVVTGSGLAQGRASSAVPVGKISEVSGGFQGPLDAGDLFGIACSGIGDLDGDCVPDLVVGALTSGIAGATRGRAWGLFLEPDGTVARQRELGGVGVIPVRDFESFGRSALSLGDLDGDGIQDLAVGAPGDRDCGGIDGCGAVWILFMNRDGSIKAHSKISATQGAFSGQLDDLDGFGLTQCTIGDLDQDGVVDLAVGALHDDDGPLGAIDTGAVWILFLNPDGTVKAHQKISATRGGLTLLLNDFDQFGVSVGFLGDLDQDGAPELAVGATAGGQGWVAVLSLNPDGTVLRQHKVGAGQGGFQGALNPYDVFGTALCPVGDLDTDGVDDLLVGAAGDPGLWIGAIWLLYLNADGTVRRERKVVSSETLPLDLDDTLGLAITAIDVDRDGEPAEIPVPAGSEFGGVALRARGVYVDPRAGAGSAVVGADVRLVAACHGHR